MLVAVAIIILIIILIILFFLCISDNSFIFFLARLYEISKYLSR